MMESEGENRVPFDGVFSRGEREELRQRRMALHLSHEKLADIFGVSWETERSWENGKSVQCRPRNVPIVRRFLEGELDGQIKRWQECENLKTRLRKCLRKPMLRNFEWSLKIFRSRPEAGYRLLKELQQLVNQEMMQYLKTMGEEQAD